MQSHDRKAPDNINLKRLILHRTLNMHQANIHDDVQVEFTSGWKCGLMTERPPGNSNMKHLILDGTLNMHPAYIPDEVPGALGLEAKPLSYHMAHAAQQVKSLTRTIHLEAFFMFLILEPRMLFSTEFFLNATFYNC
ncbi:hypothetical protein AVEN_95592-1 [Araneus ventricosus]|uniref:Uncharacterized protein n=1 Tax=Araneus ventricosus TaxID=182803 RepID=A0A4Y2G3Z0_ARAVE|nr:hypothetical protein AVEN_95592-1 [Araneus ventricosus]